MATLYGTLLGFALGDFWAIRSGYQWTHFRCIQSVVVTILSGTAIGLLAGLWLDHTYSNRVHDKTILRGHLRAILTVAVFFVIYFLFSPAFQGVR